MADNSIDERTVWCGNLSDKVTEEILYELFLQVGPLERVRIPKDRDGRSRSFGFVTFCHICSVEYALKIFEGTRLFNRPVIMKHRLQSSPQFNTKSNVFKTPKVPEPSRTDFIRGLFQPSPVSSFSGPPNSNHYTDRSLVPDRYSEEGRNSKRKYSEYPSNYNRHMDRNQLPETYEQDRSSAQMMHVNYPPTIQHIENERLRSTYVCPSTSAPNLSYEAYMELGKQMLASILQPMAFGSVQNSYYGTPLVTHHNSHSRHAPYPAKDERNSRNSYNRSDHRSSRSYDRHDHKRHH